MKLYAVGYCRKDRALKGPKHEIFCSRVFVPSKPEWVGDLGTWLKKSKFVWLWLENRHFVIFNILGWFFKNIKRARPVRFKQI